MFIYTNHIKSVANLMASVFLFLLICFITSGEVMAADLKKLAEELVNSTHQDSSISERAIMEPGVKEKPKKKSYHSESIEPHRSTLGNSRVEGKPWKRHAPVESKSDAGNALNALQLQKKAARTGRNPQTGATIK